MIVDHISKVDHMLPAIEQLLKLCGKVSIGKKSLLISLTTILVRYSHMELFLCKWRDEQYGDSGRNTTPVS